VGRWPTAPSIVAESLVAVPDALVTGLRPGPPASAAAVAAQLAGSLSPAEHPVQPPRWLLGQQATSFRRVLAAIQRHRGALLADPVGSGKTFVALAVAQQLNRGTTVCLVPASLVPQWEAAAARLAIPVTVCSHQQVSRGHLPQRNRGLVIVDESHHYRNPHTRRYRHLAPWLIGRSALFLTATPIVNRAADLAHQLLLAVRDDALTAEGVTSIRQLLRQSCSSPALGQLVFENEHALDSRPARVCCRSEAARLERSSASRTVDLIDRLRISHSGAIAELLRGVFLRAASSSPAALKESFGRYRRLLLHARDALAAGHNLDRSELRRFTQELDDQLVWWELLPVAQGRSEIELGDLDLLSGIVGQLDRLQRAPDPKLERLRSLLSDGIPTLVFTTFRATVRYIRDGLASHRIAWCTGDRAGIGVTPVPRRGVLGWFRNSDRSGYGPLHLVVTDVAAEGLDLQRVARVVHYDLPWTPTRIEQREGRAVRYGSQHSQVTVVRFELPPLLERRLGLNAVLARKGRLPGAIGLGSSGRRIWKWRDEVARRLQGIAAVPGVAWVTDVSCSPGVLAGFALHDMGQDRPLAASVIWMDRDGSWTHEPELIEARLDLAAKHSEREPVDPNLLQQQLARLTRPIQERVAAVRSRRWLLPESNPEVSRALSVLQKLVGRAARRHDHGALAELERAIAFLAGGHTAGEVLLTEMLAQADQTAIRTLLKELPSASPEVEQIEIKLTGLIFFGPAKIPPASVASPPCPTFKPRSSTSTEPSSTRSG
jgi:helicase-like protein